MKVFRFIIASAWCGAALFSSLLIAPRVHATENVPHTPFAEWAKLPDAGDLVVRVNYQESEAYHFWAGHDEHLVDLRLNGEHYGIDINQGYIALQYGLTDKWAADLSFGFTTVGWRFFSNFSDDGASQDTTGLMDISLGLRRQLFAESEMHPWKPFLAFRVAAVLPGGFDERFPFAPGTRSTAIAPELLLRKHFGWAGLGIYGDSLFRWNHTSANDHYIVSVGLFQQLGHWELSGGYRHLGSINGDNIQYDQATRLIIYPRAVRENQDSIEAGFSYRTPKHQFRFGFYSRTVFDGVNTDKKFWLGGFLEMPFTVKSKMLTDVLSSL
jgi:hypothetical protein